MKRISAIIILGLASIVYAQNVKIDKETVRTLKRLQMIFSSDKYCTVAMVDSIFGPYNEFESTYRMLPYGNRFTRKQANEIEDKIGNYSDTEQSVFLKWFRKENKGKVEPDSLIIISIKKDINSGWFNNINIKAKNKKGDIIRISISKATKSINNITINGKSAFGDSTSTVIIIDK